LSAVADDSDRTLSLSGNSTAVQPVGAQTPISLRYLATADHHHSTQCIRREPAFPIEQGTK
jgi:hypothetical protein